MKPRLSIAVLALSAAGLTGIALHEGYSEKAVIPVKGDVPTLGFGTTAGVKLGDRTTPPQALRRALADVQQFEAALARCITAPLHQHEYDAFVSLAYNIGPTAFCESTLAKRLNAADYTAACTEILKFVCGPATEATRAKSGEPCYSKLKPLRKLRGLEARRQQEYRLCMGETP